MFDSQKTVYTSKTYFSLYENYLRPLAGVVQLVFLYSDLYKDYLQPLAGVVELVFDISAYTKIIFDPVRSRCVSFC